MAPKHVLLAWELGAGLGHLMPLRAIAQHLISRGYSCSFALRSLDSAEALGLHQYGRLLPAPYASTLSRSAVRVQASYASLLHNCGWDHGPALAGSLRAWRNLIELSGAQALIADHAPTALLAAHSLGLPAAASGTGFSLPPLGQPLPRFPLVKAAESILVHNEGQVLNVANTALATVGAPSLPHLQALFARVHPGLKTYVELDHYGLPRDTPYLGLPDFSSGLKVDWGATGQKRVLAYLRPSPGINVLLSELARLKVQTLVRVADISPQQLEPYRRPGLVFVDRAIWFRQAAESCDVFINYGAHGAAAEMLLAGKPCLMLPFQVEQRLLSDRLCALGAGLTLHPKAEQGYAAALQRLLDDSSLRRAAEGFASRYAGQERRRILPDWLDGWLAGL